ncbi:MAG: hypothetical protein U0531_16390 [Dehalococcoidia bacterium]
MADLAGSEPIEAPHLAEALQYRAAVRLPRRGLGSSRVRRPSH